MAEAELLPGNRFRLLRESDTPGTFEYLGLGVTLGFSRSSEFEDATAPDLTAPLAIPNRRSVRRSRGWDLTYSGKVDAKAFEKIEADEALDVAKKYQILVDKTAILGGRTYTGTLFYERLEMTKTENGFVTFSATCRGDGPFVKAAVT